MNQRTIRLPNIDTNTPNRKLRIRVGYEEGGTNYFTGNQSRRGFYLYVTPVEIDGAFEKFMMFSGAKALIEESPRFNAKRLRALADAAPTSELMTKIVSQVAAESGLQLVAA